MPPERGSMRPADPTGDRLGRPLGDERGCQRGVASPEAHEGAHVVSWGRDDTGNEEMKWNGDCIPRCVYAYNVSNKTTDKTICQRSRTDATYNARASAEY